MKKIATNIIIALIFLGLGIFIGNKFIKKATSQTGNAPDTFQAGWNAAKVRLAQSPIGAGVSDSAEIKTVSGTIQKIDGNKLTVKIIPVEPLADPNLDTRIITVDSNTKISLKIQKDPQEFQKEMQDFQDQMKNQQTQSDPSQSVTAVVPPMPFENKDIKVTDLKENQQISITANDDIKDKKEFTAAIINAQDMNPQVVVPVSTPATEIANPNTPNTPASSPTVAVPVIPAKNN